MREVVVTFIEDALGEKRLAAYVVPAGDPRPAISDLRRWLKDRLPEPMVPSSYVVLNAMPLSPNGKLDRSALPPPDAVESEARRPYVPPRTTAEEILAGITAELAGAEPRRRSRQLLRDRCRLDRRHPDGFASSASRTDPGPRRSYSDTRTSPSWRQRRSYPRITKTRSRR